MNIKKIIYDGMLDIAELAKIEKNQFFFNQNKTICAFMTNKLGLAMIGLTQIGGDLDYFDLKCRFFLGAISKELNPFKALQINNDTEDYKYGITEINKKPVLTATEEKSRFIISWGKAGILSALNARYGILPYYLILPGLIDLNTDFYINTLESYGYDKLITIKDIVNLELFEKEIL